MKKVLIAAITLAMAGAASAAIPQLNYQCPGQIQMHSDEGGPVYINGKEAKLKKYSEEFYEAKGAGVTLSISNTGGQYDVSYTSKKGSGTCQPGSSAAPAAATAHKASPAEKACLKAVSDKTDVAQQQLQVIDVMDSEAGVGVTIKVPGADAPWSCLSDKKGHVQGAAYTGN
ncbi:MULTISPECIES: hypothetical protein [Aeromonas]|uniref:hypothetical protein n=1 Tax=Aeromonas TaxID=642 RepID=UPI0021DF6ED8|nr:MULTISPECIES: hypothetical protein [Aeromonas]MCU9923194.1 hypothetical protein [Aeromonas caviae]MDU7580953.1 hypothetical protein [Aeromonas sp.]